MKNRPVPESANRLAREKSPYLLQHAHNPVDWLPWGEEAFALARAADKPVFLSTGAATMDEVREIFDLPLVSRHGP